MSCPEFDRIAPAAAFGTLDAEEGSRLAGHLEACPECRDASDRLRRDSARLGAALLFLAPTDFESEAMWAALSKGTIGPAARTPSRRPWIRPAAAAAGIAVGALLWLALPGSPPAEIAADEAISILELASGGAPAAPADVLWSGRPGAERAAASAGPAVALPFRPLAVTEMPPGASLGQVLRLRSGWIAFRFTGAWEGVWAFEREAARAEGPVIAKAGGVLFRGDPSSPAAETIRRRIGQVRVAGFRRGGVRALLATPAGIPLAGAALAPSRTGPEGFAWGIVPGGWVLYPRPDGTLPDPADLARIRAYLDPWGRPYRYVPGTPPRFVSAGPDGEFGTADDVGAP